MKLFSRFPWLGSAIAWVFYALGVVWRWFYIIDWHDPRKYVYSDMKMYVELAKRIAQPAYVVRMGDVTHPPGNTWLVAYFLQRDPTLYQHIVFNFVICALVPLAVGALGWVSFGKRAGEWSMVVASGYYAFVDFGGYFLAEIHIAFTATLTIALYLLAMKMAAKPPTSRRTVGFVLVAVLGGILFSISMALKMVAMPAIGGFCIIHFLFTRTPARLTRAMVFGAFMISALPLSGYVAARCTKANEGHFCTGSNKSAADFLLGHYGRIQGIEWHDPKTRGVVGFGSPAAYQHGYREKEVVQFAITDQKHNNEAAWRWTLKNPGQALVLSVEHVWDCFGGSYPWPPNATGLWPGSCATHYIFLFFFIFPSLIILVDVFRSRGVMGLLRSTELFVVSPIFGVCLSVFVATGEVRYRVPWDGVFIVLGVEFYRRMKLRFREPALEENVEVAAVADASPVKNDEVAALFAVPDALADDSPGDASRAAAAATGTENVTSGDVVQAVETEGDATEGDATESDATESDATATKKPSPDADEVKKTPRAGDEAKNESKKEGSTQEPTGKSSKGQGSDV